MINIEEVKRIPDKPGCYIFINEKNEVIYVGKANNLKRRVSNYFQNEEELGRNFIHQIEKINIFITGNQKEALILEQNLIKKYQPRYNVLLKNSNAYPYIHITKDKNPRYVLTYKIFRKDGDYFGPFPDGSRAKEILSILERIFPLAKCKQKRTKNPCIYYSIGQCSGHCFRDIEFDYYKNIKKEVFEFFEGKTKKTKKKIKTNLDQNIKNLSFEIAQKQKKILDSIDFFVSSQNVEFADRKNRDFLGIAINNNVMAINIFMYRYGKLLTSHEKIFSVEDQFANQKEIVQSYIFQFYKKNLSPTILYTSENIEYKKEMEEELKIKNIVPKIGKMKKIMDLANSNAEETLKKNSFGGFQKIKQIEMLKIISEIFKIEVPYKIEALDISNILLQDAVACFSQFINGEYKKSIIYELKTEKSDFDYMESSCKIHFKKIKDIPNLLIVDGGREQIKSVKNALQFLDLNIEVIGLVKDNKHMTEKMMNKNFEEVFFLDENVKKFLTNIQDIVHYNAISSHRKLHIKNSLKVQE